MSVVVPSWLLWTVGVVAGVSVLIALAVLVWLGWSFLQTFGRDGFR